MTFCAAGSNKNMDMDIEKYSKYIHFYTGEMPALLLKYLIKVKWESYLDLGCGDGFLLYALNKRGYFKNKVVYAVDLSENRINVAKRINKDFRCFVNNACNMQDIKDNSINFLVSTQLIEHVLNDEDMVREIKRVLDKNSIAFISTIFKRKLAWWYHRCNGKWTLDPTHLREYTQDDQLLNIFRKYDLEIIETKKSLVSFPIIISILRIIGARRNVFDNFFWNLLINLRVPIFGYYGWEIVCRKT